MSPRHMSAVPSSSTRKPIDTTLSTPGFAGSLGLAISSVFGWILPSAPPSRPSTPSMRGTLKPQMSASSTPTVRPRAASAAARFTVTDDLPTPPLPLAIARTRVVAGISVGSAFSRAFHRARCIAADFCSWFISPYSTVTSLTPGMPRSFETTSVLIWPRSGHAAVVSATPTVTWPSGSTVTASTMPSSTMLTCSSGSITPRSIWRTSSALGAGPPTGSSGSSDQGASCPI